MNENVLFFSIQIDTIITIIICCDAKKTLNIFIHSR